MLLGAADALQEAQFWLTVIQIVVSLGLLTAVAAGIRYTWNRWRWSQFKREANHWELHVERAGLISESEADARRRLGGAGGTDIGECTFQSFRSPAAYGSRGSDGEGSSRKEAVCLMGVSAMSGSVPTGPAGETIGEQRRQQENEERAAREREAKAAAEWNEELAADATRARLVRGLIAVCCAVAGVILLLGGWYGFAFASFGFAVVFVILFVDAHGQLKEVRERPVRWLVPKVSSVLGSKSATDADRATVQRPG